MTTLIRSASTAALVALVLGVAAGRADAAPFNLTHDPEPNVLVGVGTPYAFSFNIPGFNVATDTIDTAALSIVLSDDGGSERIRFTFDGQIWDQQNTPNPATPYSTFGVDIASTLADGVLNIVASIQPSFTSGSYFFNSANLQGSYTRRLPPPPPPPNGVPEPATLVLLGVGLLGAGFARRRTKG